MVVQEASSDSKQWQMLKQRPEAKQVQSKSKYKAEAKVWSKAKYKYKIYKC
jgi:hypothetical protein